MRRAGPWLRAGATARGARPSSRRSKPGRRLAFTWCGEDGESSLVELTLDDAPGGGTILTVFEVPLVALRVASRAVVAGGERAVRGPAMVAVCA